MRKIKRLVALSGLLVGAPSGNAGAWVYDDSINYIYISGAACRASSDGNERKVNHFPGSTTVKPAYDEVRLYCPIARRNLNTYNKQKDGNQHVKIASIAVRVSPGAGTQCRLFGKDASSGSVQYSTWNGLFFNDLIWMNLDVEWESYQWGLQCDVGGGESIKSIYAQVYYNH